MATDECGLDIYRAEAGVVFEITILAVRDAVSVLVVDDNHDLVNFFRRYTTDTPITSALQAI